jgi:DnaJ-class molecular chaperone
MPDPDYDYHDSFLPDGCVWCDKCGGSGLVPDFENWDDENCPVCYGEGFITKERAEKREASLKVYQEMLAKALAEGGRDD